jgi:hypothetical protein
MQVFTEVCSFECDNSVGFMYCIILYLFSIQNIHEKDTEHCQHQHTDNNKYIKCKVLNTIIKIKLNI